MDLLKAFALASLSDAVLVYAGEGSQRLELENEATRLGISGRVRFLGFLNQSQLPSVYAASDLMVLPSEYEPFGVVVNEAFCCGCPVIASDRVGAARDLIAAVDPRLVYPWGNVEALSMLLGDLYRNPAWRKQLAIAAERRMAIWTPQATVDRIVAAVVAAQRRAHQDNL